MPTVELCVGVCIVRMGVCTQEVSSPGWEFLGFVVSLVLTWMAGLIIGIELMRVGG